MQLDFPPWRLSGTVLGPALNDPAALAALGDAIQQPPYKAAPKAPVLYVQPRNTRVAPGTPLAAPPAGSDWTLGASLALVIGRPACRVAEAQALSHVAGWTLVADLFVPPDSHYRPAVRFKARDGSCLVGPGVAPATAMPDPAQAVVQVSIDGQAVHEWCGAAMTRSAAKLIQDVSEFMTLHAGDVLLLGVSASAPRLKAGQRFALECAAIGRLEGQVAA